MALLLFSTHLTTSTYYFVTSNNTIEDYQITPLDDNDWKDEIIV